MNIICKYSGIEFTLPHFSKLLSARLTIPGEHPIFSVPLHVLLNRQEDWIAGKLDKEECRLLFVALLHSTGKVIFTVPALPSHQVIQQNMERMFFIANWYKQISMSDVYMNLPKFSITHSTASLSSIGSWIDVWQESKIEFMARRINSRLVERIEHTEEILERAIKSSYREPDRYSNLIASWIMDVCGVPLDLRQEWVPLFRLRGVDLWNADLVKIEEMLEHMEEHMGDAAGTIYGFAALAYVREMRRKNLQGMNESLGISDRIRLITDNEDDVQSQNVKRIIASAPVEAPIEANFPSKVTFLRAKAAWHLRQNELRITENISETLEQRDAVASEKIEGKIEEDGKDIDTYFRILNDAEDDADTVSQQLALNMPFRSLGTSNTEAE